MYQLHHAAIKQTEMKSKQRGKIQRFDFGRCSFANIGKSNNNKILQKHVWDSSCELILILLLLSKLLFAASVRMSCLNVICYFIWIFFLLSTFPFGIVFNSNAHSIPFAEYENNRNYNDKTFLAAFLVFCNWFSSVQMRKNCAVVFFY